VECPGFEPRPYI